MTHRVLRVSGQRLQLKLNLSVRVINPQFLWIPSVRALRQNPQLSPERDLKLSRKDSFTGWVLLSRRLVVALLCALISAPVAPFSASVIVRIRGLCGGVP